jgi:hypothetical protein
VSPEVKQAALKKLFTDPHFNVMDGLDTYIDDYGKPDPLPPGMLRKMAQSQLLGLFDHEKEVPAEVAASPQASATAPAPTEPPHDGPAPADPCMADAPAELPPPPGPDAAGQGDQPVRVAEALTNPPAP